MARTKSDKPPTVGDDLATLTKVRLNTFVLVTTLFGYLLAARYFHGVWFYDGWLLFHTLLGTACTAFGSAAFNQLMEIEQDARMKRTSDRPLPARRMLPTKAFGIGWALSAFGIVHLAMTVSGAASFLAATALGVYVFLYTPLKRRSSTNTLMGAIPGAIPPMIGWAAVAHVSDAYWLSFHSMFLFTLLFLWQMPHFVAISWLCREEYEDAGYVMWTNGDHSGKKTAAIAGVFTIPLMLLGVTAWLAGMANYTWLIGGTLTGLVMLWLCHQFSRQGDRPSARKLFLYTLLYLPLALALLAVGWNQA